MKPKLIRTDFQLHDDGSTAAPKPIDASASVVVQ
jgi:hypothetical protein